MIHDAAYEHDGPQEPRAAAMTESPILRRIERHARAASGSPAVTDGSGTMTYGRLWDEASACAELLAPYGGPGVPIGLCLPAAVPYVPALLGAARTGHAAILLPSSLGTGELRAYCRDAGVRIVLATADQRMMVEMAGGRPLRRGPAGLEVFTLDAPTAWVMQPGDFIGQLTSGADNPPKVAVRTHAAVWTEIEHLAEALGFTRHDATLVLSAISHSYGLVGGTLVPLCWGARVILGDRRYPEEVLRIVQRERPTILFGVPVAYAALAEAPGAAGSLSSLRLCLSAGSPLPQAVEERFAARYGHRICQDYGSTEVGTISLSLDRALDPVGSVGRPLPHVSVTIVDPHERVVPPGERGQVVVRSPALARRYLGAPSAASLGLAGDHLATGDLGWLDGEGYLFLAGRMRSLIHAAGGAVDPVMVESVISRLPGVREVAVVGVPGAAPAERLKAVVVAEGISAARIREHCRAHLGGGGVPEIVEFRDAIPRTPAGKILRHALRGN
jgi:acyl-CoA synthetase (AMP-forming)/AMP-acid ligase II